MSYTPGPWDIAPGEWKDNGAASWLEIPVTTDGPEEFPTVAITYCVEDARLIAAAPDLLEALEGCVAVLGVLEFNGVPGDVVFDNAREAIAQATGSQMEATDASA